MKSSQPDISHSTQQTPVQKIMPVKVATYAQYVSNTTSPVTGNVPHAAVTPVKVDLSSFVKHVNGEMKLILQVKQGDITNLHVSPSNKVEIEVDAQKNQMTFYGDTRAIQETLKDLDITGETGNHRFIGIKLSAIKDQKILFDADMILHSGSGSSQHYSLFVDSKTSSWFMDTSGSVIDNSAVNLSSSAGVAEANNRFFELPQETATHEMMRLFLPDTPRDILISTPVSGSEILENTGTAVPTLLPVTEPTPEPIPAPAPSPAPVVPPIPWENPAVGTPVISSFAKTGTEDNIVTFTAANFTSNYTDPDNQALVKVKITSLPANGTLKLSGVDITLNQEIAAADLANITFVPGANWNGITQFDWRASDGNEYSNVRQINITVTAVNNDAPDAINDAVSVNEDAVSSNLWTTLLGNDTDPDAADTRTITSVNTAGTLGTVTFNAGTQTLTFTADNATHDALAVGQTATTSFTYTMQDSTALSDTATITMTIQGVNDTPTLAAALIDQFTSISTGLTYQFTAGSFTDIDATDTLSYTAEYWNGTAWAALPGWLAFNAGTRTFTVAPGAGVAGTYTIRVTATDPHSATIQDDFVIAISPDTLYGTPVNDTITATAINDVVIALAGNDVVYAGNGNDTIYGNDGTDDLRGENGDDLIYGGNHSDLLYGAANNDTLYGEDGTDTIYGDTGDDSLIGATGSDSMLGGSGNDTLDGGADNDTLDGGEGQDIITTGLGSDRINFYTLTGSTTVLPDTITDFTQGQDKLWVVGFNAIGAAPPVGQTLQYTFDGTYTNVSGASGFGFRLLGNYTLTAADFQFLSIMGTAGNDTLTGTSSVDGILGLDGDDVINALAGNDLIWGGNGNDTIDGGVGADTIYGEAGNDVFVYGFDAANDYLTSQGSYGYDTIKDFVKGQDRIDVSALPINGVQAGAASWSKLGFTYNAGTGLTEIRSYNTITDYHGQYLIIYLEGNIILDASDFIFNATTGTAGGDNITGTAGADNIIALAGNDTINAGDGDDDVTSDSGNNYINLGNGNNHSYTNAGIDTIIGGSGKDHIRDYGGTNYIFLRGGSDFTRDNSNIGYLFLGSGNDEVYNLGGIVYEGDGNVSNNGLHLGTLNDQGFGDRGNDRISGNNGDDTCWGGGDTDTLWGGLNNDSLIGGYGVDTLYGGVGDAAGAGQDRFVYFDINESTTTERDTILDFKVGTGANSDKIVIYGFTGIAQGAASGLTLGYSFAGGYTTITSDPAYSFSIRLSGDYTSGGATPFDIPNNFEFRAGILGTMGADNAGAFATTAGSDFVMGLEGNDSINGGDGNDSIFGGHNDDVLSGENGTDSITGGYNNDTLIGGAGADTLEGSSGVDRFTFTALGESTTTDTDVINDFLHGTDADKIVLTGLGITGFGAGASELTVTYVNQYTVLSHNSSTFQIKLLGYYELGTEMQTTDFVF